MMINTTKKLIKSNFGCFFYIKQNFFELCVKITHGRIGRKNLIKSISKKLEPLFKETLLNIEAHDLNKSVHSKVIWTMWWQGDFSNIVAVNTCLNAIKEMKPSDYEIIIINQDNYSNFIELPRYIIEKVNKGYISLTHLSDIIRMALLSKYGGYWLDSTILPTNDFNNIFNKKFWTVKTRFDGGVARGRWTSFALAGENIYWRIIYQFFLDYWSKYDVLIDYFLIDYAIDLSYKNVEFFRSACDILEYNNEHVHALYYLFDKLYDEHIFKEICKGQSFFKTSYKNETSHKQGTFFDVILREKGYVKFIKKNY